MEGETAQFNATASGINEENFMYQWKKRRSNNPTDIVLDVNGEMLSIPNVTESDEGQYYCTVTNEWGRSVESNKGTLTISGMFI